MSKSNLDHSAPKSSQDKPDSSPAITVLPHKYFAGMALSGGKVHGCTLAEALEKSWPLDAHFCAYAPRTLPSAEAPGERAVCRLNKHIKEPDDDFPDGRPSVFDVIEYLDVPRVEMVALVGDIDDTVAHKQGTGTPARPEWRAEVLPKIEALGLPYYETNGGYRVLGVLPDGFFTIENREVDAAWTDFYLGWCEGVERATGLAIDRACADWTRSYRLPNVEREGKGKQRAAVVGALAPYNPFTAGHYVELPPEAKKKAREAANDTETVGAADADHTPRAVAIGEKMRAACERGGSQDDNAAQVAYGWCLLRGCEPGEVVAIAEVASANLDAEGRRKHLDRARRAHKAEPSKAVRAWLGDEFDAVNKILNPTGTLTPGQRKALERVHAAAVTAPPKHEPANDGTPEPDFKPKFPGDARFDLLGRRMSFNDPPVERDYVCPGLALARCRGKISLLVSLQSGGKTPIERHAAVCMATGAKIFGAYEVHGRDGKPAPRKVLYLDREDPQSAMKYMHRLARGIGKAPEDLADTLHVFDASDWELLGADGGRGAHFETMAEYIRANEIDVLLLDSYSSAMLTTGIEMHKPEFARLAHELGQLDVLVLATGHINKEAGKLNAPIKITDVAHSGQLTQLGLTIIGVHYPDLKDKNRVQLNCVRSAAGKPWESFDVRFEDADGGEALKLLTMNGGAQSELTPAQKASFQEQAKRAKKDEERGHIATRVIERLNEITQFNPLALKTIARELGHGEPAVGPVLTALVRLELVGRDDTLGRHPMYYAGKEKLRPFERVVFHGDQAERRPIGGGAGAATATAAT